MGNKWLVTTLLYRGSEHGWNFIDFHSRCDKKGPTICLFKIKDGDCIGGYTNAQWSSEDELVDDIDAMLFNLSCYRHYPTKRVTKNEIFCYKGCGPRFGGNDLKAHKEPFNGEGHCFSQSKCQCYGIPVDDAGKNLLTNLKNG